jgi:hypothetical protein
VTTGRGTTRKGQTLVPGHTLRREGAPYAVNENQQVVLVAGRYWRGLCSWHTEHKTEVSRG